MGVALHRLFPFVDYVCSGEGDLNFPLLARHLLRGEPVGDVPGIIRRVDGQTVEPTVASAPVRDLDALPVPDYDDFMQQRVACGLGAEPNLIFPVETARGCWWGEKSHCTFCGLNGSTMQFRSKSVDRALREFAEIMERYDTGRLTAVDNILDMRYFHDLLPRLAALDLPLEIFYETKANLRREQVRLLREAGVAHIQPGIESLSDNVLRLMRKGVTALQNVQLLRWCAEYMVHPMWNVLAGFPGEDPADYARQAALVPLLSHLSPPELGRVIPVRLDRFSPLFVDAAAMGVQNARAAKAYDYVYPFAADDLAKLAYYFRFDYADGRTVGSYVGELNEALATWSRDAGRHHLIAVRDGDSLVIYDTRAVATRPEHRLQGLHRAIYTYCGEARTHAQIAAYCATLAPPLGAAADVDRPLRELEAAKLILALNGRYLSLAVSADYWIDCLAARHGRGRPVPASMQPALRALLDPRLPVANALFAAQVLAQSQPLSGAGSGLLA
jgi:ribosomal peptide maturation radical SAM protein 1